MADAGFFKGTSAEQDRRFTDKENKLLRSMKFPPQFDQKVDMRRVRMDIIRPWVVKKVIQLLGLEDEVVIEYAIGLLEEEQSPDPKKMQINLTGFLTKETPVFMAELWNLLLESQADAMGVPKTIIEEKKHELRNARAGDINALDERDRRDRLRLDEVRDGDRGGYRGRGRGRGGRGRGRGGFEPDDRNGRQTRDDGWGSRGGGGGSNRGGNNRRRSPPGRRSPSISRSMSRSRSRSRTPPARRYRSPPRRRRSPSRRRSSPDSRRRTSSSRSISRSPPPRRVKQRSPSVDEPRTRPRYAPSRSRSRSRGYSNRRSPPRRRKRSPSPSRSRSPVRSKNSSGRRDDNRPSAKRSRQDSRSRSLSRGRRSSYSTSRSPSPRRRSVGHQHNDRNRSMERSRSRSPRQRNVDDDEHPGGELRIKGQAEVVARKSKWATEPDKPASRTKTTDISKALELERRENELKEKALRNKVMRSRKGSVG